VALNNECDDLMDDDAPSWLYSAPLATLLLCGAVAIFLLGYVPEAEKARECEARVREVQSRISELSRQETQARQRIAELKAGVPEAVEEAVREVLRLGSINDFLPMER
jgi:cell division protein FtsB